MRPIRLQDKKVVSRLCHLHAGALKRIDRCKQINAFRGKQVVWAIPSFYQILRPSLFRWASLLIRSKEHSVTWSRVIFNREKKLSRVEAGSFWICAPRAPSRAYLTTPGLLYRNDPLQDRTITGNRSGRICWSPTSLILQFRRIHTPIMPFTAANHILYYPSYYPHSYTLLPMVSEREKKWDAYTISRKQSSVRDIHFPIFDANSMTPSTTEKQNINKSLTVGCISLL